MRPSTTLAPAFRTITPRLVSMKVRGMKAAHDQNHADPLGHQRPAEVLRAFRRPDVGVHEEEVLELRGQPAPKLREDAVVVALPGGSVRHFDQQPAARVGGGVNGELEDALDGLQLRGDVGHLRRTRP